MIPVFSDNRHMSVAKFSALRTGRFYPPPPREGPSNNFCLSFSRSQDQLCGRRVFLNIILAYLFYEYLLYNPLKII